MNKTIGTYFVPVLVLGLVSKAIIFGIGMPESLVIGFLSGVMGVQSWFYLKRLHLIESKKLVNVEKEIKDLKLQLSSIKIQNIKPQVPNIGMGNAPWQK